MGEELVELVEDAHISGRVLPSLNSNFITLVPKTDKPSTFADFHPISHVQPDIQAYCKGRCPTAQALFGPFYYPSAIWVP